MRYIWILMLVTLGSTGGAAMSQQELHPALENNQWRVIAHQGGNLLRPGDTMIAFSHAVELGVDALELDVHMTADRELVVLHDDTVDRTTNGTGRVSDLTLDEIRKLDAGYNWPFGEDDNRPYRGAGVTIPTLEEVLSEFPQMPMVIEMKQREPSMFRVFGELLRRYNRSGNTIVASFHPDVLVDFRQEFPEFATSGSEPEILRFYILNKLLLGRLYRPPMDAFQVPERARNLRVVQRRFVRVAQSNGLAVHVWTVNDREGMERILSKGVDGIITDRPDILLEVVGEN